MIEDVIMHEIGPGGGRAARRFFRRGIRYIAGNKRLVLPVIGGFLSEHSVIKQGTSCAQI